MKASLKKKIFPFYADICRKVMCLCVCYVGYIYGWASLLQYTMPQHIFCIFIFSLWVVLNMFCVLILTVSVWIEINFKYNNNLYSRRTSPVASRPWWGPLLWSPSLSTSSSYSAAAAGGGAERWWACHVEDQCYYQFYYLSEQVLPWLLFYGGGIVTCIWSHLYYTSLCWREEKVSRSQCSTFWIQSIQPFFPPSTLLSCLS